MKRVFHVFCLYAFTCLMVSADVMVEKGDSEWDVRKKLGTPSGVIENGNEKILSYSRGEIILTNGKVTKIEFLPNGMTWDQLRKQREENLQKRMDMEKDAFQKPLEDLKESKEYKVLSPPSKIERLKKLKMQYPNVNITKDVEELQLKITETTEKKKFDEQTTPENPEDKKPELPPVATAPPASVQAKYNKPKTTQ